MDEVLKAAFWFIIGWATGLFIGMLVMDVEAAENPYIKLPKPTLENLAEPKTKSYYIYDDKGNTKYIEVYPNGKNQKGYQEYDFNTKKWNYGIIQEND